MAQQLVIQGGKVTETYPIDKDVTELIGPDTDVVEWPTDESFSLDSETCEHPPDPRTPAQRTQDNRRKYRRRRMQAMPSVRECLAMIFRDMRDGSSEYVDAIMAINQQFPPPSQE